MDMPSPCELYQTAVGKIIEPRDISDNIYAANSRRVLKRFKHREAYELDLRARNARILSARSTVIGECIQAGRAKRPAKLVGFAGRFSDRRLARSSELHAARHVAVDQEVSSRDEARGGACEEHAGLGNSSAGPSAHRVLGEAFGEHVRGLALDSRSIPTISRHGRVTHGTLKGLSQARRGSQR